MIKQRKRKKRVMVFGTFDILHPGHLDFLKQARQLGHYLIVSVARDKNVKKFKGLKPVFAEKDRLTIVSNIKFVDRAVLGGEKDYLPHIIAEKPDIIALGYDQIAYLRELMNDIDLKKLSVVIFRLKPYKSLQHKSSRYKIRINKNND